MEEMSKYEQNLVKARALKDVGESIESSMEWCKSCINDYEDNLEEYEKKKANGEEVSDYEIRYARSNKSEYEERLRFWEIAKAAIDKELMF